MAIRRIRGARKLCAGILVLALSANASANFTCEGKITYLGLGQDGLVTVSVAGFGVWYICSPTFPYTGNGAGFSPEGCRAWYAAILAAQKSDHSIRFFFSSSAESNNGPQCAALGTWRYPDPAPYHMTVMN